MLEHQPSLRTERLWLRPFVADQATALQELAGVREVADTSLSIPHPYSISAAKSWIASQTHWFRSGQSVHFAAVLRDTGELIGAVELYEIESEHAHAAIRFWVGMPWWGSGLATEGALEVLRFGFEERSLNRIAAYRLARDEASARVLRKLGMRQEGRLRQRVRKWDAFEDLVAHAVLRESRKVVRSSSSAAGPSWSQTSSPR